MGSRFTIMISIFLVGLLMSLLANSSESMREADNYRWPYVFYKDAVDVYLNKSSQFKCKDIPLYIEKLKTVRPGTQAVVGIVNRIDASIRDAAIFRDKKCENYINTNIGVFQKYGVSSLDIDFYLYAVKGDKSALEGMLEFYGSPDWSGDHVIVIYFAFLQGWGETWVRIVRQAVYADASGWENACEALRWKRYIYGENAFKLHLYRTGAEEGMDKEDLNALYAECVPEL